MTWILIFNGRSTMCAFAKIPFITFLYLESPAFRNHYPLFDILELNNNVLSTCFHTKPPTFCTLLGIKCSYSVRTYFANRLWLFAERDLPFLLQAFLWSRFDACPNCHARESHSCKVPHKLWELRFWAVRRECDCELFMAHCYVDIFRHSFHA